VVHSPELQAEIKTEVVRSAEGMHVCSLPFTIQSVVLTYFRFLLAQLHLDSLIGRRSPWHVRTALKTLPTGAAAYDHAYEDAMRRTEGQVACRKELAKDVLSWITCAKRPLTTSELRYSLAVDFGDPEFNEEKLPEIEDIISVCAGFGHS
jgi:hypothetical protein